METRNLVNYHENIPSDPAILLRFGLVAVGL